MERRLWFKLGKERKTRAPSDQTMDYQTMLLTIERNTLVPSDQTMDSDQTTLQAMKRGQPRWIGELNVDVTEQLSVQIEIWNWTQDTRFNVRTFFGADCFAKLKKMTVLLID